MNDDFRYSIDLSMARARAEKIIECIKRLREHHHDLGRFEYTSHLRVAPTEIPHSHPVLTLNAELYDADEILCEHLHEQMHWISRSWMSVRGPSATWPHASSRFVHRTQRTRFSHVEFLILNRADIGNYPVYLIFVKSFC
jgi:hypothetical protein